MKNITIKEHEQPTTGQFVYLIKTPEGIREVIYSIIPLNDYERSYFCCVPVDPTEQLVRIQSERTQMTGISPVVKLDFKKGLVYFVFNRDDEQIRFKKPVPLRWMSLNDDYHVELFNKNVLEWMLE